MANEQPTILTKQGKIDLEKKLDYLRSTKRAQIAERIKIAREFGDISENAEYEAAKAEQGFIEGTISQIERDLQNCIVIDTESCDEVALGTKVTFSNVHPEEGKDERYTMELVGTRETNPQKGRISNVCPLGMALIGHGVGDLVDVRTPSGVMTWKIEAIQLALAGDKSSDK